MHYTYTYLFTGIIQHMLIIDLLLCISKLMYPKTHCKHNIQFNSHVVTLRKSQTCPNGYKNVLKSYHDITH